MNKKPLLIILVLVALGIVVGGVMFYRQYNAPTHIAFVNFMDFQYDAIIEANDNDYIKIDRLSLGKEEFPDVRGYAAVYFFAHGSVNLNDQQRDTIKQGIDSGVKIYFSTPTVTEDLSNLSEAETKFIKTSLQNGGTRNLRGVLNYSRRVFHGKTSHTDEIGEPFVYPKNYYYHLGEEDVFETLEAYEAFYKEKGRYTEGGPKVALLSQILGLSSGRGFLEPLIEGLEAKGMNVYPVTGFSKRMDLLEAVDPDLMIFIPHGRLAGTAGPAWLKKQNIPMLSPLVVFAPHEDWEKSQQGMDGGMLSQNVVMAELDGGVVPYAIAAQFENERGLLLFEGLDQRIERLADLANRFVTLQTKPNKDKKLVVFYYKGAGKNAMVAEGLEIAPSLLNLLKRLKAEGYSTGPLPETSDALYQRIQVEGPVIGGYAKGALENYYANGNPELIPASTFRQWMKKWLPPELYTDLEKEYGPAPGPYMSVVRDGQSHLVVSRLQFGNVVLMPVPPAGYGDDDVTLVHGVKKAPPYPYIGGYLWAKEGFQADAIVHFGTHGSVEFTPWKQVALSDHDWPDILTSGVPHFYLYSINNIGEALVAKRRTYATMSTHITPPFMASGIYDDIQRMHQAMDRHRSVEDPLLKKRYLETVRELVISLDMHKDLDIENIETIEITDELLLDIHTYMHDLEQAKVTKGLHVLGRPYSDEETYETVRLIAIDYLAYTMAQLDELNGKITKEQAEDSHIILEKYREPSLKMIDAIYQGQAQPADFFTVNDAVAMTIHKPVTVGHTHADGTTHTHVVGNVQNHNHGNDHTHGDGTTHTHANDNGHSHNHGDEQSHNHSHAGAHDHVGTHDGMLAMLRDSDGKLVGQVELKLHDDKGDLELWVLGKDGKSPYDLAAETLVTVIFESVNSDDARNGTTVTLAVRNMDKNEDEDGIANIRTGGKTNYFIFPGDTDVDASWLKGKAFKAKVHVLFKVGDAKYRTDVFSLVPHTHGEGQAHSHSSNNNHGEGQPKSQEASHAGKGRGSGGQHGGSGHGRDYGGANPHSNPKRQDPPVDPVQQKRADLEKTFRETLESIDSWRSGLEDSPQLEVDALVRGLAGGYIEPQTGGDPVVNPSAVPSGRNLVGIDAEKTPTQEAWDVGRELIDQLLATKLAETGAYPKKVGFSLWSSEFVRQEGITIAEILYLLGVEPVRNRRGVIHDVRLIPSEELGRPRIDVIVQTSGQFRDLGASRIYLINKAVELAASAEGTAEYPNYVAEGAVAAEDVMKQNGVAPDEAKALATLRVFGGLNGNYGAGIMGMVESGDRWDEENQVADQYLNNMGAVYDQDRWGDFVPGMFEAALQNADTVVHPRSSNTWGPLSLDHVYEFMGGMTLAIRHVTGEDPDSYFSDLRNSSRPTVQNAKKAIWHEARTTMLNPKYIAAMQEEGATAAESFAETFRNTYGWDVMQPTMIDEEIWNKYEEVYVQDKHHLQIQEFFQEKNPYALQEMTAIMLETVRKGYWNPDDAAIERIIDLHTQLIEEFGAGCSGFVCDNAKLREMISQKLDDGAREDYLGNLEQVLVAANKQEAAEGITLEAQDPEQPTPEVLAEQDDGSSQWTVVSVVVGVFVVIILIALRKRKQQV
ncbi:cobaltochelatase subunit CobN [Poriferisphaera sp. WC338]|uniref:cobaltochelatase subunit CobN n=1 Tax=Poriferisphaera sp. WC338 TaxID=3425129 RepID=UPI003D814B26